MAAAAPLLHDSSRVRLVLAWVYFTSALQHSVTVSPAALGCDSAGSQASALLPLTAHPCSNRYRQGTRLLPTSTATTSISTATAFIALNGPHLPSADLGVLSTAFGRYFKDLLSSGPVAAQLTSPFSKVMPLHAQVHPANFRVMHKHAEG